MKFDVNGKDDVELGLLCIDRDAESFGEDGCEFDAEYDMMSELFHLLGSHIE